MTFIRTVVLALACVIWAGGAFAQGKWTKLAAFPEPAEELLGASAGGKMYVFCGLAPGWKAMGMVYEYDPASDKWAKKKPMPLASHHVSFTEYKGKIYAFGGFVLPQSGPAAWVPIDNAWEYDPATDNWKALAPLPTKRGSPVAVTVGDKMYVIGGEGQEYVAMFAFRALEAYEPAANNWAVLPNMPVGRHGLAGAVVGNRLHMVSGDVQSAGTGVQVHTDSHDAFEFPK